MTARVARTSDGGRVAYVMHGDARDRAVLLLGALAGTRELWRPITRRLAPHARVIVVEHRGIGASSRARTPTSTRDVAADALAVLDDAGIERADVFGISLGGMAAIWLAAEHPQRVRRLALASTLARGVDALRTAGAAWRGLRLATCALRSDRALGECLGAGVLSPAFHETHPERAAAIEREITDAPRSRRSFLALGAAAAAHDARDALPRVTAPTLVLRGALDPLVTAPQADAFRAIPDVHFAVIANAGHAVDLEAPDDVAARLLAFFGLAA